MMALAEQKQSDRGEKSALGGLLAVVDRRIKGSTYFQRLLIAVSFRQTEEEFNYR